VGPPCATTHAAAAANSCGGDTPSAARFAFVGQRGRRRQRERRARAHSRALCRASANTANAGGGDAPTALPTTTLL